MTTHTVGSCTYTFSEGTSQATIDKVLKAAAAITGKKEAAKFDKRPGIPSFGKSMPKPSKLMLDAAARGEQSWRWESKFHKDSAEGLLIVHDPATMQAAVIDKARRALARWDESDPQYSRFMAKYHAGKLAEIPTDHLERVVASNLKPGARMSGIFAASLIYGLEELERRGVQVAA